MKGRGLESGVWNDKARFRFTNDVQVRLHSWRTYVALICNRLAPIWLPVHAVCTCEW